MKPKTTNHSTKARVSTKRAVRWQDNYLCFRSMKLIPIDIGWLEERGKAFLEFCFQLRTEESRKERKVTYERFLEEEGIDYRTMGRWRKKSKKLDQCIKFGMMCIGNFLEEGLLFKDLSEKATMWQLHHYLDRWKKCDEYHDDRAIKRSEAVEKKQEAVHLIISKE